MPNLEQTPSSSAKEVFTPRRTRITERLNSLLEDGTPPKDIFLATGEAALMTTPPIEIGRPALHTENSDLAKELLMQQSDNAAVSKAERLTASW